MNREELEKKAKSLNIDFDEDTSDKELEASIKEAEKKNSSNDDNIEYWKTEFEKAKNKRDDLRKANRDLRDKFDELQDKLSNAPSQEEFSKIREQFNELKKFRETIEKEREEEELKQKSQVERVEISFRKQLEDMQKQFDNERDSLKKIVKEKEEAVEKERQIRKQAQFNTLEGNISRHAAKFKAVNPDQVVRILRGDFDYDDDTGEFLHFVKDTKGKLKDELSVEEYVKKFLEDESNSNLVRADSKKTPPDPRIIDNSDKTKIRDKNSKYDPNSDDIKNKADRAGLAVEDYIETLIQKDEKLSKIDENRKSST